MQQEQQMQQQQQQQQQQQTPNAGQPEQPQQPQQPPQPQNPYDAMKGRFLQILEHFWKNFCLQGQLQNCLQVFIPGGAFIHQGEESLGHENVFKLLQRARGRHNKIEFNLKPEDVFIDMVKGVNFFKYDFKGFYKDDYENIKVNKYTGYGTIHLDPETMLVRRFECFETRTNTTTVHQSNQGGGMHHQEEEGGERQYHNNRGGHHRGRWRPGGSNTENWVDWTCLKC